MNKLFKLLLFKWEPRTIRGAVYKIQCGHIAYIGGTTQLPEQRFKQHIELLQAGTHTNVYLQNAYESNTGKTKFEVLWRSYETYHDELAQKENEFMNAENQAFICNMKPAHYSDYSDAPTCKSHQWEYPIMVWGCILLAVSPILCFVVEVM